MSLPSLIFSVNEGMTDLPAACHICDVSGLVENIEATLNASDVAVHIYTIGSI